MTLHHSTSASFKSLVGQAQAIQLLTQAIHQERIAPAYLFVGPEGVGRALGARCFIHLICVQGIIDAKDSQNWGAKQRDRLERQLDQNNHPDLLWVEPTYQVQGKSIPARQALTEGLRPKTPPKIRLPQVREVAQFLSRAPLEAPRNLVVLESAQTMAEPAANGLLKTLEEPGQATLILIAPSVEALLPTLVSRCQRIPFRRLNPKEMAQILQSLDRSEILDSPTLLAMAQGSPGEALHSWDSLQALSPELLALIQSPPQTSQAALTLARQISQELELAQQLWLLNYLQHSYWQSYGFQVKGAMGRLEQAKSLLQRSVQPRLVWEVTLLKLLES
jgi:DNA polymerase-3 subunit delta'